MAVAAYLLGWRGPMITTHAGLSRPAERVKGGAGEEGSHGICAYCFRQSEQLKLEEKVC
jgi:hypothetical protein